jgi:hypothetical protein
MFLTVGTDAAEQKVAREVERTVPEAMGSRLAKFCLNDYRSYVKVKQALGEVCELRAVLPEGCGLWTHRREWDGGMDGYVTWNVVVACRSVLSEKHWMVLRKAVMLATQMDDRKGRGGLELASLSGEADQLTQWVKQVMLEHGNCMGSVEEVQRVLAAV